MDLQQFLWTIVRPGLIDLDTHGGPSVTQAAERFLIAIALQEADATHRYQNSPADIPGPARGFWQFETAGVLGVMTHRSTAVLADEAIKRAGVVVGSAAVHRAIEGHDQLAVQIARLLILTHPDLLPETEQDGWAQYINLWRPGRPHPDRWSRCWKRAHQATLGDADTQTGSV